MTEQITPGSATFNGYIQQLVGYVDWNKKHHPSVTLDVAGRNELKQSIKIVFPWLSSLSDTERYQLPQEYIRLYDIRSLTISLEDLIDLCPSLIGCQWLQELDILGHYRNTYIYSTKDQLPEGIGHLSWLKKLGAGKNKLRDLPPSLYQCKELEYMNITCNQLQSLNEKIGCLTYLKELYIGKNKLTSLPQSLYQCKQLESLDISGNQLEYLDEEIGNLSSLQRLYVGKNKLAELPQSIYQCKQLEYLSIISNQFQSLNEGIGLLSCLKTLDAALNILTDLPQSLYQCKQLEALFLSGNQLSSLHENIGSLQCLKWFHVNNNQLTDLPHSLYQCKHIENLNLSSNQLHFLHEDIGCLRCLDHLDLDSNKLTKLPKLMYQCRQLEWLSIRKNLLQSLHEEIGQLHSLTHLQLSHNRLTDLPVTLYQCKQLHRINVSNNQLTYIHEEIGQLGCLSMLNISHNNIKKLPLEILKCAKLKQLKADNNDLNIPLAVLNSDISAIFNYLQEIRRKGSTENNTRNIMLLGNTLAGKTSLLNSLLSGMPYLTKADDRTHGIEKYKWVKKTANKPYPYLNIRVCDFGGHACYKITTAFFWNENSLFVVIFDLDTYGPKKYRLMVGQWMEMIAEAIPRAVILIVGTHKDKCIDGQARQILREVLAQCNNEERIKQEQIRRSICNMRRHKQKYDKLQEMLTQRPCIMQETFAVSSKTFEGIEAAGNAMLSIILDETYFPTTVIPLSWHYLKDLLSVQADHQGSIPWLAWDTLRQLGIQAELKAGDESIRKALKYLRLSSDILWYEDNDILRNTVFNQPNELIGIFKALISHDLNQQLSNTDPRFSKFTVAELAQIKADLVSKGKLTKDVLQCIWKDFASDKASFELLVTLMLKFDFGYVLPRPGNCVDVSNFQEIRIPWFVKDDDEPALVHQQWPVHIPTEDQQISINVDFRRWAPVTLVPSLCVRVQMYVTQTIEWKNGMFATTSHGHKLLLKLVMQNENEAVLLNIRGKNLHEMWQVLLPIHREMDALLDMWPGVIFSQVVLCPGCVRKKLPDPTLHSNRWLYEVCTDTEILCNNCVDIGPIQTHMVYPPETVLLTLDAQYQREDSNFLRYQKLILEYGSETLHRLLESHLSPKTLQEFLQEKIDVFRKRLWGRNKWIFKLLYPISGSVKPTDMDISTLTTVIKLLDSFPPPHNGWSREPAPSDLTQGADLLRLTTIRNNLAHIRKCQLNNTEFEKRWVQAEAVIKRLGGNDREICRLKFAKFHINS